MSIEIAPEHTLAEAAGAEPFSFTIVAHVRDENNKVSEQAWEFLCAPDPPFGEFMDFITTIGQPGTLRRLRDYVDACLVDDEERTRFEETLHTPGARFNPQLLDKLSSALIEKYAERPTSPPSASASGRAPTARRSRAGASSRASARSGTARSE